MVKKMLSGKNAEWVLLAIGMFVGFIFGNILSGTLAWLFGIALVAYVAWSWYSSR